MFGLPQSKIGSEEPIFASPLINAGAKGGVAAKCAINRNLNWLPSANRVGKGNQPAFLCLLINAYVSSHSKMQQLGLHQLTHPQKGC